VSTIVFLHAHPDDEASQTSGTMALAADRGDRVVVVFATGGEHGERPEDLPADVSVADHRRSEAEASARVLGIARVAWLGYVDSGMTGWEQNHAAGAFCAADLGEAAERLAAILREESADVLVGYDWHGVYGHPDHVRVHEVARAAAELTGIRVLDATLNRSRMIEQHEAAQAAGLEPEFDPQTPMDDGRPIGSLAEEITWDVDVTAAIDRKRASLEAHRSQATDIGFFLSMPDDVFRAAFGEESYIDPVVGGPARKGWPF
jgi:LmbE family N-acetylglucosaminyl deacetylase